MVPKPAIPARISSSDQEDRGTNITATELTGGMVPNLQVAEPVGTKAHGPQNDPNKQVIDLTDEPDEDLQKALALSLQEEHERNTGFISQEQADIDRAVAASMSDGTTSRRTVAFREAENPRDKIRMDNWPVGLKNVGNTCWFSAVIQSLFYIPEFRRLVLEFTPHKIENKDLESRELRNVSLVTNLRRLFALMLRGRRKYLDPSECISILRSGLGDTFSQHDVSETTHLLLQWLEEAFSLWNKKLLEEEGKEKGQMELEMEIERKGENSSCIQNPLIGLFYGQLAVETVNGNRIDGRTEQYSQCIIQVSGMSDLHQGIEAFTKESVESSPMVEANQNSPFKPNSSQSYRTLRSLGLIRERWFQDLPPVLTFELKRFLFNSVSKRPEKIHDRVLFPRKIFMDRYLQSNREKVVELRTIADDLLSRKQQLEERILRIDEFGNETEKYSLPRVLRYTRRFIESRRTRTTLFSSQPVENTRLRTVASTSSPHRRRSLSATDFAGQESESKRCRVLTNEEFQVIDTCLDELHEEICKDLEQLGKDVAKIDAKVDMLYDKPDLQTVAYDLHAVMVHGGEAASGHYWSYIWDQNRDTWMKFNDHLVTEASWTELEKDAYGGPHTKASAYCLIYVDEKKRDNLLGSNFEDNLPSDLMQFVEEDSKKLEEECQAWDEKQREPMEVDETSTVNASNAEVPNSVVGSLPTQPAEPQIDFNKWELAPPGSNFSIEQSSLEKVQEHQKYESANDMFNAFFQYELSVYESSSQSQEDRRVDNFACYLVANGFMKFIQLACLVMMNRFLALTSADGNREHLLLLEITTNELNNQLKVLRPEEADELTSLNNSYKGFLIDVYAFIYAVECIQKLHRYDECIPVLSRVYFDGRADRELGENRRINTSVIFACLRKALQELNAIYISKFRAGKGTDQLTGEIQWSLVPGLVVLSQSKDKEDEGVVERLRGSWCALLDGIGDVALEKILTLILDCRESRDLLSHLPSTPINRIDNLPNVYKEALNIVGDKS